MKPTRQHGLSLLPGKMFFHLKNVLFYFSTFMQEEKKSGDATANTTPEQVCCKNCMHYYSGNFCSQCGQSTKEYDKPLKFFFVDFAGNIFVFDTRLWQSLKHILLIPGRMESNFVSGKRIRYMPPFRLYVFVSFIFFLSLSWATGKSINKGKSQMQIINSDAIVDSVYNDIRERHPEIYFSLQRVSSGIVPQAIESLNPITETATPAPIDEPPQVFSKMDHIIKNPEIYMDRFFK